MPSVVPRTVQVAVPVDPGRPLFASVPSDCVALPVTSSTPAGRVRVVCAADAVRSGEGFATVAVTVTGCPGATGPVAFALTTTFGCGVVSGVSGRVAAIANGS